MQLRGELTWKKRNAATNTYEAPNVYLLPSHSNRAIVP